MSINPLLGGLVVSIAAEIEDDCAEQSTHASSIHSTIRRAV